MKFLRFLSVLLIGVLVQGHAHAGTFSYDPSTTAVSAGGTFTFTLTGSSANQIGGFDLYLTSSGTGSEFQLTNETLNSDFSYLAGAPALPEALNSTSNQDLGAFANSSLDADTTYPLGTFTISVAANTPTGPYTIGNTAASDFGDPGFTELDPAPANSFTINVVSASPEPSTWMMLLAGFGLLAGAMYLRRAASL